MELIDSVNNKKVIAWSKLSQKKYRDEFGLFLVEGDHLINEGLKNNAITEIISINPEVYNKNIKQYLVSKQIMNKISNQVTGTNVIGVCAKLKEQPLTDKILILDNISDPGNLGTIIRSAIAFGFYTILLGEDCVDLYNDKVIRATEGLIFKINIIRCNLTLKIKFLKSNNYYILGTSLASDPKSIKINNKLAIVIGNEGSGVKKEILDLCDSNIKLNMNNEVESLNAGVAASILMYLYGDYHE